MLIKWLKKDVIAIAVLVVMPLILPCLFSWLLGNLYVEQIPFGVVDLDNSALSRQIIRGMEDHPGLDVVFVENQHTLEEQIYSKNLYGGMVIPTDFYKNLTGKHPKDLLTLIDGTNTLIASNTMGYVSAVSNTYGAGVMLSLLEAQGMTAPVATHTYNTFQYVERTLYDPYLSYMSFLLYFSCIICCAAAGYSAWWLAYAETFADDRNSGSVFFCLFLQRDCQLDRFLPGRSLLWAAVARHYGQLFYSAGCL